MNNTLSKILILASGATISSVITWKIITDRYSQIIEKELESITDEILEELDLESITDKILEKLDDIKRDKISKESDKKDKITYSDIIKKSGYQKHSNRTPAKQIVSEEVKEEIDTMSGPYVISPEEFDEQDNYEVVSLVYYSDGVLTNEDGEVIEDIEGTVGKESLKHFGEYEDDSVFVRNDELKTDFEILLDSRNFSDIDQTEV